MLPIGRQSRNKSKGITFIELILVTVIILVLAALTPPLFRGTFTTIQLRNTAQNLVQLTRYLQTKAISERKLCRINFDFEKGTFWPTVQDELLGKFERLKGRWGKTNKCPENIAISSEDLKSETPFITFYPDGSTDKAKIKISDDKGKVITMTTQRAVGYVQVQE